MQTFKKSERLSNFFHKEKLFSEGKRMFVFPFGITYLVEDKDQPIFSDFKKHGKKVKSSQSSSFTYPCKVLISAPKRLFKRATERNRVRRLIKEAFRKNKMPLYTFLQENELNCLISVVYSNQTILPYCEIEDKIVVSLKRLCKEISKTNHNNNC